MPTPTNEPNHATPVAVGGTRVDYEGAAAYLGLKVSTLRSMVCRKQIPHLRLGPQLVRFDLATLDAWLAECVVAPATS